MQAKFWRARSRLYRRPDSGLAPFPFAERVDCQLTPLLQVELAALVLVVVAEDGARLAALGRELGVERERDRVRELLAKAVRQQDVDGAAVRVVSWDGRDLRSRSLEPGVHMLAHDDVDDASTARIAAWLDVFRAATGRPDAWIEAWLDVLGIGASSVGSQTLFIQTMQEGAGYDFIRGWGSPQTPSIVSNHSDQQVRIPGKMRPQGVAVHPSPTEKVVIRWQSPFLGELNWKAQILSLIHI